MRRPALYGFIGSGNLGNDASFEVALSWLRSLPGSIDPLCITLAPEQVRRRYGIDALALRLGEPGDGPRVNPAGTRSVARAVVRGARRLLDGPRSLWLVSRVDAVIVPGMGVLEEKLGVRPWGLPFWLFAMALSCRLLRRRFVLLCVGAEPIHNPLTRRLFVATIGLADHVSYRDEWSAWAMREAGARAPEAVAADLVFARAVPQRVTTAAATTTEPRPVVVGLMDYRGSRGAPAARADVEPDVGAAYLSAMTDVVLALLDAGDRVVLVGGDADDARAVDVVRERVTAVRPELDQRALTACEATSYDELSEQLAGAEAAVVTRFHNLVCALQHGLPVVSIGYAAKNARLLTEFGVEGFSQPIEDVDAAVVLDQLRRARGGDWPAATVAEQVARRRQLLDAVLDQASGLLTVRGGPPLGRPDGVQVATS